MIITDYNGEWLIEDGKGCINKCLINPSETYILNNPTIEAEPTTEEVLADLVLALSDKGVVY